MELADESGIESLTMRELGRRLGVEAASLYNHVAGKDDLLEGMTAVVLGEIAVQSDSVNWKEALARRATSARDVFSRHPWASGLIDTHERGGRARLSYIDGVLGSLLQAGFSPSAAGNAFLLLHSYIYGFERQRPNLSFGVDADTTEVAGEGHGSAPADTWPSLVQVAREFARSPRDDAAVFDFGLGLILDGLERHLGSD